MPSGDMHPYVMVVLDRLIGAVVAQGRPEHAASLLPLFHKIWNEYQCPTVTDVPYPLILVFGKAVPNAFLLANEQLTSK